jgi:osmotically-inducible protein OsmY
MRVRGVRAVAQELEVRLLQNSGHSDDEIARRALDTIKWNVDVPSDWIKLVVDKGCVTLTGEVDWQFQREAAAASIRQLTGVKDILNHIVLRQRPKADDLRERIEAALRRSAEVEAHAIRVLVDGDRVVLEGRVRSPLERQVLEGAVWAAPGVRSIDDRVEIGELPG